jgi:hypothetical protein
VVISRHFQIRMIFCADYFCADHDELCCRDCLAKTHKSCVNTMSLDSASKGAKHSQLFSDCQEQLTNNPQFLDSLLIETLLFGDDSLSEGEMH